MEANKEELPVTDGLAIRIETADDLKHMIEAVNSGDRNAADAHYVLAGNINMKGAKLTPMGDSESYPFSGIFDGSGYTISNFTIDCHGAEYGGFFGCTKNAKVANLALDYILKGKGGVTVGGVLQAGALKTVRFGSRCRRDCVRVASVEKIPALSEIAMSVGRLLLLCRFCHG